MICVIFSHMIPYYNFDNSPMLIPILVFKGFARATINYTFFYISGYGFRPKSVKVMLQKTFSELIKPYILVAILTVLLLPIVHYIYFGWWPGAIGEGIKYFYSFLLGISESRYPKVLFGYELYNCAVVWFLLALFVAHNMLNLILKVKGEMKQHILVGMCVLVGYLFDLIDITYFCLAKGLVATGYCYAGYLLKKNRFFNREKHPKYFMPCVVGITVIYVLWNIYREFNGSYSFTFIDVVCIYFSAFLLLYCGVLIGQKEWRGCSWIKQIGMYTYWIMCIHSVEGVCLLWYRWGQIMAEHQLLGFIIDTALRAVIIGSSCVILKKISKYQYSRRKMRNAA